MFKSCCVCVSKKVIEDVTTPEDQQPQIDKSNDKKSKPKKQSSTDRSGDVIIIRLRDENSPPNTSDSNDNLLDEEAIKLREAISNSAALAVDDIIASSISEVRRLSQEHTLDELCNAPYKLEDAADAGQVQIEEPPSAHACEEEEENKVQVQIVKVERKVTENNVVEINQLSERVQDIQSVTQARDAIEEVLEKIQKVVKDVEVDVENHLSEKPKVLHDLALDVVNETIKEIVAKAEEHVEQLNVSFEKEAEDTESAESAENSVIALIANEKMNEDNDSPKENNDSPKKVVLDCSNELTDKLKSLKLHNSVHNDSDTDSDYAFERILPPAVRRKSSTGGILKRPSIISAKLETMSDDDEVFCPPPRKSSLPASVLIAGAVGRDELSLRRHRAFSELVGAARAAADHRVRFHPLGPLVAPGESKENGPTSQTSIPPELEQLLIRLEKAVSRLEQVACVFPSELPPVPGSPPPPTPPPCEEDLPSPLSSSSSNSDSENSQTDLPVDPFIPIGKMSVLAYQDIIEGPLASFITTSIEIGGDVATHANIITKAFQAQLQFLTTASQCAQPSQAQLQGLLAPTSQQIQAIQEFREKNRASPFFNHLSAISESIPALGWVAVSPTPSPYVKEMMDAGQFYTNRVLKDWKDKDDKHVKWCNYWIQSLQELQKFVKQYHTTGLVWGGSGGACPPPPPCGMPPPPPCPPPVVDFGNGGVGDERSALFAQINQGEDITKSLKKVTSDMQTHKNPNLREGPAPFKTPVGAPKPFAKSLPTPGSGQNFDKPPVFNRDGKKWLIEYHKGNQNLLVDNADMNNVVYMFRCRESALTVKGKINSIVLDSCTKCAVVFDSLVSSIEFVNCQSVQMQVLSKVPTISIDKTDGCQMYLSNDSLEVEVVSSKSSEMNVLIPKGNGDYTELPVAEQFKTTINKGTKSLVTVAIENKG